MDNFEISCDPARLELDTVHAFLSGHTAWARGIPRDVLARALDHSLVFGGYLDGRQVAFARVVSDRATFANLLDVFVLPPWRGRGYSRRLMEAVQAHPDLQGLRRFTLATSDAHGLYAQYGFTPPLRPATLMEKYDPQIYQRSA